MTTVKFQSGNPDSVSFMTPWGTRFNFQDGRLETDDARIIETMRKRIAAKLDDAEEVPEFAPLPVVVEDPRVVMTKLLRERDAAISKLGENPTIGAEKSIDAINAALLAQTAPQTQPQAPTVREPGNGAGLISTSKIVVGAKASNVK